MKDKDQDVAVGQRYSFQRKDGSLRHALVTLRYQESTVERRWVVELVPCDSLGLRTKGKGSTILEKSLLRRYERTYTMDKNAYRPAEDTPQDLPTPQPLPEVTAPEATQMEAMREQLLEADAAQPDDAPPLEAQLNKAALPKAVRLMVEYCEKAPVKEILWAMERQFQTSIDPSAEDLLEEARHKLTGLVVGVALGVTLLPAEPLFPALVSADRLARLVKVQRKTIHRKKAKEKTRLRKLRKERKAKRRASKRTR